jgi:hypothetical protein
VNKKGLFPEAFAEALDAFQAFHKVRHAGGAAEADVIVRAERGLSFQADGETVEARRHLSCLYLVWAKIHQRALDFVTRNCLLLVAAYDLIDPVQKQSLSNLYNWLCPEFAVTAERAIRGLGFWDAVCRASFQTMSADELGLFKRLWSGRDLLSRGAISIRFIIASLFALAGWVSAQDFQPVSGWQNLEFRTYAPNFQEIAVCKAERVFPDHRTLGFFKVRLLPVLVVQGVRVEFAAANPTNEWAETFQPDWLPKVKRSGVEWRDVTITSQKAGTPRFHAGWAQPAAGTPTVCLFKDVTLEANGVKWQLAQAELRSEAGCPCVVWKAGGGERHLNLFSAEISDTEK